MLLTRCTVAVLLVELAWRLVPFRTLRSWVTARAWQHTAPEDVGELVRSAADFVEIAFTQLGRQPTCLKRAIALKLVLRSLGVESDVRLGVATSRDAPFAHAWLEVRGEQVTEGTTAVHAGVASL